MMESSGKLFVIVTTMSLVIQLYNCDTRYYVKVQTNSTDPLRNLLKINETPGSLRKGVDERNDSRGEKIHWEKSRSSHRVDDEKMIRESLKANQERRNSFVESSTFDPDVLNKFLDEYANKIKITTEKNVYFPFGKPSNEKLDDDKIEASTMEDEKVMESNKTLENASNSTVENSGLNQQDLNDTLKRNKYFGTNVNEDRNGWVTLEAIPWSKSKISKWQASSSSQRPWPETKIWEKPNYGKPWNSEFPSRPAYINNEPWNEGGKPSRPQSSPRPTSFNDRFDDNPNQAQKWPPERPQSSWEKFPSIDSYRPNIDIITDDRPSNFPNNWDKYIQSSNSNNNNNKQTYFYNDRDRYTNNYDNDNHHHHHHHHQNQHNNNQDGNEDWQDNTNDNYHPSKYQNYKDKPTIFGRPINDYENNNNNNKNRPQQMSHYQYRPEHPANHPSSGDGQWVLLSTNRGYSKSRQRSIKFEEDGRKDKGINSGVSLRKTGSAAKEDNDGTIAVMTSKRQVRLTVLPSINGTNTTTSHGGLLEVEKTFKTVDQSQKEYEKSKLTSLNPIIVKDKPSNNIISGRPSKTAVLAAVGAGMLPATMAMVIPMILGRKKRSSRTSDIYKPEVTPPETILQNFKYFNRPENLQNIF